MVGGGVMPAELFTHAFEQRINGYEELFRWKAAERFVPKPLMAHGADTAGRLRCLANTAEGCRDEVTMLEGGRELVALVRVMPEPVQQFRKAPFRRIPPAAPLDGFQADSCAFCVISAASRQVRW